MRFGQCEIARWKRNGQKPESEKPTALRTANAPDDRRENGARRVVTGEAGLAHTCVRGDGRNETTKQG